MKKKGLIISTAVMVVVLIAALTTGTFAWFSTTALARLENINVQTAASKGLEIASYTLNGTSAQTAGTLANKWGLSYSFDEEAAVKKMMGVSGNGITMYKLEDGAKPNASTGKPEGTTKIAKATAGEDYFVGYVALRDSRGAEESDQMDIVLNSVTITVNNADGVTADANGILASMRIAIFKEEQTSSDGTGAPTTTVGFEDGDTPVLVYEPYGYYNYSLSGGWTSQVSTADTYLTFDSWSSASTYSSAKSRDNKFSNVNRGTASTVNGAPADLTETFGESKPKIKEESVGSADKLPIYLMIVIWFEGEDPENLTIFSGGGATIAMEFTLEESAGA